MQWAGKPTSILSHSLQLLYLLACSYSYTQGEGKQVQNQTTTYKYLDEIKDFFGADLRKKPILRTQSIQGNTNYTYI